MTPDKTLTTTPTTTTTQGRGRAGGRRGPGGATMGADLRSALRLSFMEAVKGVTKDVSVTYLTIGQVGHFFTYREMT